MDGSHSIITASAVTGLHGARGRDDEHGLAEEEGQHRVPGQRACGVFLWLRNSTERHLQWINPTAVYNHKAIN